MSTGRIWTIHPDYKERFEFTLMREGFASSHGLGTELFGVRIVTSKKVPVGEVWMSNSHVDEGGKHE